MNDRVLVDTSAWIAFFRQTESPVSQALKQLLRTGLPVYTGIIATELFRGAKSKKEIGVLEELLASIECITMKEEHFRQAGELGNLLLRNGFTISTIDCLIAQIAIANDIALMTLDSHFTSIARYSSLRLFETGIVS